MAGAPNGGAELFFERLAVAFQSAGVQQTAALKTYEGRMARLADANVPMMPCSFSPLLTPLTKWRLAREIRRTDTNIILSWMNRATQMTPKTGVPHVARLGGFYNLKYYRQCDWLVANTRDIADYLIKEGWPAERVHYQVNFVPDGLIGPPYTGPNMNNQNRDGPIIAALGRLHPNKAFDSLIRAFADLKTGTLWLAGNGPEEPSLRALADEIGVSSRVHFLGWHSDPQSIIRAADIFICPSRHEPFGNVIAEAMACGKPIVATASNGARELIEDGVTGLLTPIDDSAALTGAIKTLTDAPKLAKKMATAARKQWQHTLAPEKITSEWIQFLAKVAG